MKILLINPPIRETYPPYIHPIGLMSVATMLQQAGHDVQIFDINGERYDRYEIADLLPPGHFDWIGISGLITTYKYLLWLVPLLRACYKNTPVVIGGGGITSAPDVYMEHIRPDVGVLGEGEYTALELSEGKPYCDILGITYFKYSKLVTNQPRPLEKDLDKFPMVNFGLVDIPTYAKTVKHNHGAPNEIAICATRGCPFSCHYCYHVFGRGVRYRSVDNVLAEIEHLIEHYGITSYLVQDECFTARKSYVFDFCQKVIDRNLNIGWACYSRLDTLDEETMRIMRKAGCYQVGFGIESGSQRILDAMNKKITVEKMRETWMLAKKHFPCVGGTMIFGYPGENEETLAETAEFLEEIWHAQNLFFIQPYPGTELYKQHYDKIIEQYGSASNFFCDLEDAVKPTVNFTEWTNEEYVERKKSYQEKILSDWVGKVREEGFRKISLVYPAWRENILAEILLGAFGKKPTNRLVQIVIEKQEM